jgi:hypothetical protein
VIRFVQPASVGNEFITAVCYCAVEKLKCFKDYPITLSDNRDRQIQKATVIKYLVPLARREHRSLDELLTRLRKLQYEKYEFYKGEYGIADGYFLGTTRSLIMISNGGERWKIGKYTIEVPIRGILNRSLESFKMRPFVPDVGMLHAYHPHHTSNFTCWSEWSQSLTEACANCHFDRIFGTLLGFLQSYYPGSPLALPPGPGEVRDHGTDMYWMVKLNPDEAKSTRLRR